MLEKQPFAMESSGLLGWVLFWGTSHLIEKTVWNNLGLMVYSFSAYESESGQPLQVQGWPYLQAWLKTSQSCRVTLWRRLLWNTPAGKEGLWSQKHGIWILPGASQMPQWAKVVAAKPVPQNPQGIKRELSPAGCPLTSTCAHQVKTPCFNESWLEK